MYCPLLLDCDLLFLFVSWWCTPVPRTIAPNTRRTKERLRHDDRNRWDSSEMSTVLDTNSSYASHALTAIVSFFFSRAKTNPAWMCPVVPLYCRTHMAAIQTNGKKNHHQSFSGMSDHRQQDETQCVDQISWSIRNNCTSNRTRGYYDMFVPSRSLLPLHTYKKNLPHIDIWCWWAVISMFVVREELECQRTILIFSPRQQKSDAKRIRARRRAQRSACTYTLWR